MVRIGHVIFFIFSSSYQSQWGGLGDDDTDKNPCSWLWPGTATEEGRSRSNNPTVEYQKYTAHSFALTLDKIIRKALARS